MDRLLRLLLPLLLLLSLLLWPRTFPFFLLRACVVGRKPRKSGTATWAEKYPDRKRNVRGKFRIVDIAVGTALASSTYMFATRTKILALRAFQMFYLECASDEVTLSSAWRITARVSSSRLVFVFDMWPAGPEAPP